MREVNRVSAREEKRGERDRERERGGRERHTHTHTELERERVERDLQSLLT